MALGDEGAHHARLNGNLVEVFGNQAAILGAPIALATRNVFEEALEGGLALRLIQGLVTGVARIFEFPAGGRGQLESRGLGAGDTGGALESGGGLTRAMAGGDELSEDRVNVVAIRVHAIPDGENSKAAEAGNDAED